MFRKYWIFFCFTSALHAFPLKMTPNALLQDSEINGLLERITQPLLSAVPQIKKLHFYLIYNSDINAFTMGEPSIFLHTGLIEKTHHVGELIAVLFHETGHIAGHHNIRQMEELQKGYYRQFLPALLGMIAGGISGQWQWAQLGMITGQLHAHSSLMGYSRECEHFADQFALSHLARLRWGTQYFLTLMQNLSKKDTMDYPYYLRTHPMCNERILACEKYRQNKGSIPPELIRDFQKIRIKTIAFLTPMDRAAHAVKNASVDSKIKLYGQAIVEYRQGHIEQALATLAQFEKACGTTPFTQEFRARIYFENGKMNQALAALEQAIRQKPQDPLLILQKASILLGQGRHKEVISLLEALLSHCQNCPEAWSLLGTAYHKNLQRGRMKVCYGEEASMMHDWDKARQLLREAETLLPKNDHSYQQRIKDLLLLIEREEKEEKS